MSRIERVKGFHQLGSGIRLGKNTVVGVFLYSDSPAFAHHEIDFELWKQSSSRIRPGAERLGNDWRIKLLGRQNLDLLGQHIERRP
jgi:hypothetical protein